MYHFHTTLYFEARLSCETMKHLVLIFSLLVAMIGRSQAPDFTVTDTYGQSHELYADYLDEDRVVVLGFFFADCPLCAELFPLVQEHYNSEWVSQFPVDVIMFSGVDNNEALVNYAYDHQINMNMVGTEGGSWDAMAPYMEDNAWGTFFGYPMFIVIGPEGDVIYDPWGEDHEATIEELRNAILNLAFGPNSIEEGIANEMEMQFIDHQLQVKTQSNAVYQLQVFNTLGQELYSKAHAGNQLISLDEFSVGAYIFRMSSNNESLVQKAFLN